MATSSASCRTPKRSRRARSGGPLGEPEPPRSRSERTADTLERLRRDVDLWVASASEDGEAYLVPLSYHWDGSTLTIATPSASPTARNLLRAGWVRAALGQPRDAEGRVRLPADPPTGDPGVGGVERARRPRADAARGVARRAVTPVDR